MKASVIICHHTGKLIDKCLASISKQDIERIIVTSDNSWFQQESDDDKVMYTPVNEPTYKRNLGSEIAETGYLAFMDDDVTPDG